MKKIRYKFEGSMGTDLTGQVDLPEDSEAHTFALFAHCFTCTKNIKSINNISKSLTDEGIGVLRFDFTGIGESKGDFSETNFSSNVGDLVAASEFLKKEYQAPGLLVGHSLGGAAVIQAASKIDSAKAVVVIAAPASLEHLQNILRSKTSDIEEKGEGVVEIGGSKFTIKKQMLDDLEKHNMEKVIDELDKPLLILHSPFDKVVDISNAKKIFKTAQHPKSFVSLNEADHLMMDEKDSEYAGKVIAAWAGLYL